MKLIIDTGLAILEYTRISKVRKYYQPSLKLHFLLAYNLNNVRILKVDIRMIKSFNTIREK